MTPACSTAARPTRSVGPTGSTAYPNPSSANATDQYVAKHFPFAWFESVLQSGDCNRSTSPTCSARPTASTTTCRAPRRTPAFSWITPNNCSDGHDAVCHGNNLSGGWSDPTTPNTPANYTGGLYSADLFLEHVIPEIEESPAFKEGGLIDVTFDEAYPPFTYSATASPTRASSSPTRPPHWKTDSAGETLFGRSLNFEPTGPNVPLQKAADGQELTPARATTSTSTVRATASRRRRPSQPRGNVPASAAAVMPPAPRTDAAHGGEREQDDR